MQRDKPTGTSPAEHAPATETGPAARAAAWVSLQHHTEGKECVLRRTTADIPQRQNQPR